MTGPGTPRDGAPTTLAWLCHPVTLLALVVLVVNDHLLKAALPGLLTGKLSDVAGLVLAPPLVAVLLTLLVPRWPARAAALAGLVAVGAGFALIKTSGYAAELASSAWTVLAGPSLVRADRTDLLTLPALGLAWWSWTRSRRRPVRERAARLVRLLVVLPPAVLAVAATSVIRYPYAVGTALLDGHPAVSFGSGYSGDTWPAGPADGAWSVSEDGGTTWRPATDSERERLDGQDSPRRQACVPDEPQRCYRVVTGHLRVEQSDDAGVTWRVTWEMPDRQREEMARRSPSPGDVRQHFASRELIVYPAASGGHEVLVANGRDGILHRRPDGEWQRDGFLVRTGPEDTHWDDPPLLDGDGPIGRQTDLLLAVALALTLGVTVTVLAGHLAIRRGGGPRWWGVVGSGAMLVAAIVLAGVWEREDDSLTSDALLFVVLPMVVVTAVALIVRASYQGALTRWIGWVLTGLLLTVLLSGLPLAGWLVGNPPQSRVAVALALLATVPGVLLAIRIARLVDPARAYGGRYQPRPPYPPYAPYPPGLPAVSDPPDPSQPPPR
ncbi:hypothetical protein [Micromonospora parathelypteridis]|uniref:Uncharacterized protein n=1 Tax=Micromonospora parathelypteridis TaxID=1839617 RepID=A0A840VR06_9ACTN|nr:hypothetical protein [Micromonospora parathelypteridis]MBB5479107.1 hypothetical protein [Micromonospora parathelypteridis]GGO03030.1 hypothetical protein GCM10011576_02930 [Micromonospora parathelypteridis]